MAELTRVRTICAVIVCALALCAGAPASAQLHEITHVNDPSWNAYFGGDAAYDPVHDCYFAISGSSGPSGDEHVSGRFISRDGATIGTVLFDAGRAPELAAVAYSPHLSDGAGRFGAFLAIWRNWSAAGLFGQIVSLPVGKVGPMLTLRAIPRELELHAGIAYSPVDRVFLIAVGVVNDAAGDNGPTRILRLNQNGQPIDDVPLSSLLSHSCPNYEFSLACNDVDVVWNPITHEFGVLYNQDEEKIFARVSGSGTVLSRTPLDIFPFWGALAVNSTTGTYLALGGQDMATTTDGAEVSPEGAVIARGVVTSDLMTWISTGGQMRLSYSTATGTFLLTGANGLARLLELNQHGVPVGATLALPDGIPLIIANHGTAPEWLVATNRGTRYIFGTSTPFGGSDARLPDCITPDPFVAFGGGTCVDRGWYPPGMIPRVCATPDPFVSLGGGRCVNGGWLPPIAPVPTPPSPTPGGCLTPDPFVALGGGSCVNGGWYPPGITTPSPPPTPTPGGCLTPDPFVALGGGRCVNGGWYPPGNE